MKIIKPIYRTKQWGFSKVIGIVSREPKVVSGRGSVHRIPEMLEAAGTSSILLSTTQGFIRRGSLNPLLAELEEMGIKVTVFSGVMPDPTIRCVEELAVEYTRNRCEAFVAVGGGSVIDCTKAAAARIVNPDKTIRQMKGVLKVKKKLPDFYAVPTTAGTGSEATAAAVVTDIVDGVHYKYAVNDICLIPKFAILDPELSLTLPEHITADTGMDALTHAVEAYTNKFPSGKTKKAAVDSVKLIYEYLPRAFDDGSDAEAREKMLLASYEAGVAITNNFVGYVHAIAHGIGALYGISHGRANAIILPYVLEEFGESVHEQLAELALATGLIDDCGTDETVAEPAAFEKGEFIADAAQRFIDSIRNMNASFGIPSGIKELRREDFRIIIKRAVSEANYIYPVPKVWGKREFKNVLNRLLLEGKCD